MINRLIASLVVLFVVVFIVLSSIVSTIYKAFLSVPEYCMSGTSSHDIHQLNHTVYKPCAVYRYRFVLSRQSHKYNHAHTVTRYRYPITRIKTGCSAVTITGSPRAHHYYRDNTIIIIRVTAGGRIISTTADNYADIITISIYNIARCRF